MAADQSKKAHQERIDRLANGTASDEDRRLVKQYELAREAWKNRVGPNADQGTFDYDVYRKEQAAAAERGGKDNSVDGAEVDDVKDGEPSAGNSTEPSSGATVKSESATPPVHPSTVPTTVRPSVGTPTVSTDARSTGGSGTDSQ